MEWNHHKNTLRRNTIFLRIYRKAWEKEHAILLRLVGQSASVEELSAEYGIEKYDVATLYQRLIHVVHFLGKKLSEVHLTYRTEQKKRRYQLPVPDRKRQRNALLRKNL